MNNAEFIDVLANLKFCASVKEGEIMYIADRVVAPRSVFTTMYRKYMMSGESGRHTADFYATTLSRAYHLILKLKKTESGKKYIDHLIAHIQDVRQAVEANKLTYKKYPYIDACFDAILIDIDRMLEELPSDESLREE